MRRDCNLLSVPFLSLSLSPYLLPLALTLPPYPLHPLHVTFLHQLSISPFPPPFLPSLKPSDLFFIAHARSPIFPLPFELSPTLKPRRYWPSHPSTFLLLLHHSLPSSSLALPPCRETRAWSESPRGVVTKLKPYPHKSFVLLGEGKH